MSEAREALRAELFQKKHVFKSKLIDFLGQQVEVRQPSIGEILNFQEEDEASSKDSFIDALVRFCFVPGTDDKLFDSEDAERIMSLPQGEWVSGFNSAVAELFEVNVGEAEGN